MHKILMGVLLTLFVCPAIAESQVPRRWEVAVSAGSAAGSSGQQLKDALRAHGYDDTEFCVLNCAANSTTVASAGAWLASVRYRHAGAVMLSLVMSEHGKAVSGFMATSSALEGERLSIGTNVRMLAATAVLDSGPLSIEAGPAVFRLRTDGGSEWENKSALSTRIGAMAGARLAIPFKGIRLTASAQYRYIGSSRGGPYSTPSGSIPSTKLNFNHAYLGLGLARRF